MKMSSFRTAAAHLKSVENKRVSAARVSNPRVDALSSPPIPDDLLRFREAQVVHYGCILPAGLSSLSANNSGSGPLLDRDGSVPSVVSRRLEEDFLNASFPGGQLRLPICKGEALTLSFRWLCIASDPTIAAVWRCFVQTTEGGKRPGSWMAIAHDYIFNSEDGSLLNPPDTLAIPLPAPNARTVSLVHTAGLPLCLRYTSPRVKVCHLGCDGWPERSPTAVLHSGGDQVTVRFSDGALKVIDYFPKADLKSARAA